MKVQYTSHARAASERVGRSAGPTQPGGGETAWESRSVGSPESGHAAWPVAERVGRQAPLLAAERARRVGRSENTHLTPKPCLARPGRGSDDTRGPGRPTGPLRGLSVFQVACVGCVYTSYARFPSSFRAREGLTWRSRFSRHVDVMKRVMRSRRDGQPNA